MRKLSDAGFTFVEGGNHTRAYDAQGHFRCVIGRHEMITDYIVRKIEKEAGVSLL